VSARAFDARERVIRAVLRVLESEHEERPHAHSAAEAEYAGEQLALAARELAEAVDALPREQQPVGWDRTAPCPRGYPLGGERPRVDWCRLNAGHKGLHESSEERGPFTSSGTVARGAGGM
jgi:hypothetical protein